MAHLGDFDASTVVYGKFTTYRPSTGAAYTLAGTPALSVYKDASTTQSTTGVTLTADFDSVTGLNHYAIDTSADGTFYAAGSFFDVVVTTGTVDSVSVVGAVVASFTIRKNSALKPTTAGRTLVVDASGLADANAVKVGPTGSGTAQTARDIGASVLLSTGTGTGQIDFTSGVVKANVTQWLGTAASTPTVAGVPNVNVKTWNDLTTVALPLIPTTAGRTLDVSAGGEAGVDWANVGSPTTTVGLSGTTVKTATDVETDTADIQARLPAALVSGRIDASVGAMAANVMTAAAAAADLTTELQTGLATSAEIATLSTAVDVIDNFLDTEIAAIKAKTDNLPSDPADASDIATAFSALDVKVDAIDDFLDTEIAAIKTKTDFLPSATAGAAGGVFIAGTNAATTITSALTTTFTGNLTGSVGSVSGLTAATVHADLDDIQSRLPAALVSGRIDASVGAMAANVLTSTAINADAFTAAKFALDVGAEFADAVWDEAIAGHAGAGSTGLALAGATAPTAAAVADAVWEEAIADHSGTVGSTAEALNAAGSAGDPWNTALPGAYASGKAGYILGSNLNATVSSRATQASVDDLPTNAELATALGTADDAVLAILGTPAGASLSADVAAVKTQTAAIEVDTQDLQTRVPAALVSGRIDASVGAMAANTMTAAAAAADLTTELQAGLATSSALTTVAGDVTAIKAKTDNLPADPADASDIAATLATIGGYIDTETGAILTAVNAIKEYADNTVIRGTVSATSPTTTTFTTSALSPAGVAADQFKGRIIVFDNDTTTTSLRGQATDITASSAASNPLLTFTALTTAPQSGDTFSIV